MSTSYQKIYDAFTSKILEDEWSLWDELSVAKDMREILEGAILQFKFPRISLERDDDGFLNELQNEEIQILASYMKIEWLNRCVDSVDHLRPLYAEADFSQANLIDKLTKHLSAERTSVEKTESKYYRSINGKPFPYRNLAGG